MLSWRTTIAKLQSDLRSWVRRCFRLLSGTWPIWVGADRCPLGSCLKLFCIFARFAYNGCMARGWESKSIEEQQITAAEDKEHDRAKQASTASEVARRKQKEGLMLERARIVRQIEGGHKRRYLELLERALAHVEQELTNLETVARSQ